MPRHNPVSELYGHFLLHHGLDFALTCTVNCGTLYRLIYILFEGNVLYMFVCQIQWGKKVFSQPPIVQVLQLKKMRAAWDFHHRYTSTMTDKMKKKKSRKSHCRIFYEFICKLWWKISIWSITKVYLPFVGNDRGQTFSVSLHKVFTHCCWYFGPFLHADLL